MARIFAHIATLVHTVRAVAARVEANRFVGYDDKTCGADQPTQGVSKTAADIGDAVAVIGIGIVEMVAPAPIAKGARVYSDANGLPTATGANNPVGRCIRAAINPGDTVAILIR